MSSILDDLTSFWHNATTGELSDSQRADIEAEAVNEYIPCQNNSVLPECQDLRAQVVASVNAVAPSTNCALRVPGFGCFQSWNTVAFTVVGIILLIVLLPTLITSAAAAARARS